MELITMLGKQVIDETLRLGGIAIWLMRETKEDVKYQGMYNSTTSAYNEEENELMGYNRCIGLNWQIMWFPKGALWYPFFQQCIWMRIYTRELSPSILGDGWNLKIKYIHSFIHSFNLFFLVFFLDHFIDTFGVILITQKKKKNEWRKKEIGGAVHYTVHLEEGLDFVQEQSWLVFKLHSFSTTLLPLTGPSSFSLPLHNRQHPLSVILFNPLFKFQIFWEYWFRWRQMKEDRMSFFPSARLVNGFQICLTRSSCQVWDIFICFSFLLFHCHCHCIPCVYYFEIKALSLIQKCLYGYWI